MQTETQEIKPASPPRGATLDQYTIATPYGSLTISNKGRRITFEIFDDIRQSEHNVAL
ncbi:unnamed protein product, partial [marine sediment metagenome]